MREIKPEDPVQQSFGAFSEIAKLRVDNLKEWDHHRGGWKYVCSLLRKLHAVDGVRFISSVEDEIAEEHPIGEPWVGFLHQVPKHNLRWFPDLERLLQRDAWKASLPYCRGLFVLSSVLSEYLRSQKVPVPVARLFYPSETPSRPFRYGGFVSSQPKRLLFVGEYLRNFQDFYDIHAPGWSKELLTNERALAAHIQRNDTVRLIERATDEEYDQLLENSVVFLALDGAPANTTVVECILRNTPVMVNRLPGVVEYLGSDYPLYYESLVEAEHKLRDSELIREATLYLERTPIKQNLTADHFLQAIQNTAIYRQLPVPRSQARGDSRFYDVSVVICSYKRVYNMDRLLQAFCGQDFDGSFEVLIWNNNYEAGSEIDNLQDKYTRHLNLNVIHSTENLYCIIRLAIASLIRSDVILICDDDVVPSPSYISTFMSKYAEYGPRAVLCCRGNVFKPHELNEEQPQRFWTDYEHLRFFDESKTDRQVHFLHADNCLVPKALMQEALQYEMERYEYRLIDDYWLSYVFSHHLKVPIWKIKADSAVAFTSCADDPQIALYHNARVAEQRINFYIEHMRQGWPFGLDSPVDASHRSAEADEEKSKLGYWSAGFGGVNMYSEAPRSDFEAASRLGVKVIRLGAVGGAQDFRYLVDNTGTEALLSEANLGRLAQSLGRARHCGLQVIITLCHVPGRLFGLGADQDDLRLVSTAEFRQKFITMWGMLARFLRRFDHVIGYDLINEPATSDDVGRGFFEDMPNQTANVLNELYTGAIQEIEKNDQVTPIILESGYWASPRMFKHLTPHQNERIIYSFHFYAPRALTSRRANKGRFAYPGTAPLGPNPGRSEERFWDKEALRNILLEVKIWQVEHGVPNERIYVGEFGICRDVPGAKQYLADLIDIFREFGWSWTVFSFRDEEWDAMNYELGPDVASMLQPTQSELLDVLTSSFK
jgi:glycosyltransferase involved in cell wall biosynthesis